MFADQLWIERATSEASFATGSADLSWQNALQQIQALTRELRERQVHSVALYFDDAASFAMALLASIEANVTVYLPGNVAQTNRRWLEQTVDLYLSDQKIDDLMLPVMLDAAWPKPSPSERPPLFQHNVDIFLQTSGSTGEPKIICKDWQALCHEASTVAQLMPVAVKSNQSVVLGSVSTQHMYGLSFRVMLSLYLGLPIYRQRVQFPELLLLVSQSQKDVIWVISPTLLHALQPAHDVAMVRSCVKAIISSGGLLQKECRTFLQRHICEDVIEIYGSTETAAIAYRMDEAHWQGLPSVVYQKVANGLEVQSLWCPQPQLLADAVEEHQHGFELLGRMDRIIKLADKRISLVEIENQLLKHAWIADVHLVQQPQGSHLAAWVALTSAGIQQWRQQGRKQVIQLLKNYLAVDTEKIALPRQWRFTTHLPRNAQHKLSQKDILHALLQPITEPIVLAETQVSIDEYHLSFQVPLDLIYFNGHFDQFHLVPGVIQLKWIMQFLQQWQWIEHQPKQIENLKFQHFLRPADVVTMQFKRDAIRQKITFSCSCGEQKIASGRVVIDEQKEQQG